MPRFPHLLSPLKVGAYTLRNRVIMGSMHTRLEHMDRAVEREVAFYTERAKGGTALLITSGCSPNEEGLLEPGAHLFSDSAQVPDHQAVTSAVHALGAKMLLQILHAGRYAKHDLIVGPSGIRSPINERRPRPMDEADIERTLEDFVRCAELAREAGYDGVEVMGSEGYLLTQFTAPRANDREDRWGGSLQNRCRFPVEVVRRIRHRLGPEPMIMYRISALDLAENTLRADEIQYLARSVQQAGADVLSTGVGWHEAPVPTISYQVPRAAWSFAVARLKTVVDIPVVASNRINMPGVAEQLIADGTCDLVALARPLLADPHFVAKAAAGNPEDINTCIACNQACLDYIFTNRTATCLVNPKAAREIEFDVPPPTVLKSVAVVGSGPAGLACAVTAAERGHAVVLFEAHDEIGGQLNLAKRVPGKIEFFELLRYFRRRLDATGVDLRLNTAASAATFGDAKFDHVVIATGIEPRIPEIAGIDHPKVVGYLDILLGRRQAGERVAIIGTGGIGHDVAAYLLLDHEAPNADSFFTEWGVDRGFRAAGGLTSPAPKQAKHAVTMFQRSSGRVGARLGVSTGWILRNELRALGVKAISDCQYERIDDAGLHYRVDRDTRLAEVDTVIICAGQEPANALAAELRQLGIGSELIGGARIATELDATRAIDEGTRLAYRF